MLPVIKKLLAALLLCSAISAVPCVAQDPGYGGLDSLLVRYYALLQGNAPEDIAAECDWLISSCKDSLSRRHVATEIFNHYKEAPVMGEEEVAIRVYDKWFKDGTVRFKGEFDDMDAKLFVDFNRNSLIGLKAPGIALFKPSGRKVTVPREGRATVLFFYDTSCSKCRLEAAVLPSILKEVDFPLDFCAVYFGSDRKAWRKFRRSFRIGGRNVEVLHFQDPEISSNYQRLYGVISTPKMFLVEPGGLIMGRRLEPESLKQLLPLCRDLVDLYTKTAEK